ncbi:hypothetical protein BJ741DRAFT_601236 [Chytriomyces cf. hyalinus JEL632]|nr:hypothetical protein BJ741DRAFT_601236 [Chytriomyces cf. hyalinus JEL632]
MSGLFTNALVPFFEPNPGAVGMCSITPASGNYIAALQQSDFSPALCGLCALISLHVAKTNTAGANPTRETSNGAQWQLIECPSVLGIQSAVTQTRSSPTTSSLSSPSARVSSLESKNSIAPLFPSPISDAPTAVITAATNPKASLSTVNSNSVNTAGSSPVPMGAIIGGAVEGIAFLIIGGFTASPPPLSTSAPPSPFIASPPPRTDYPTSTDRSTPSTMPDHVVVVERPREKEDSFLNAISVNGNNRNAERGYNLKVASDKGAAAQAISRYENVDPVNWTVSEVEDLAVKRCGATEAVVNLFSVLLQYLIKRIKDLHDTRLAELSQGMNNAPPSYDAQ